jgi:hypothetical protein
MKSEISDLYHDINDIRSMLSELRDETKELFDDSKIKYLTSKQRSLLQSKRFESSKSSWAKSRTKRSPLQTNSRINHLIQTESNSSPNRQLKHTKNDEGDIDPVHIDYSNKGYTFGIKTDSKEVSKPSIEDTPGPQSYDVKLNYSSVIPKTKQTTFSSTKRFRYEDHDTLKQKDLIVKDRNIGKNNLKNDDENELNIECDDDSDGHSNEIIQSQYVYHQTDITMKSKSYTFSQSKRQDYHQNKAHETDLDIERSERYMRPYTSSYKMIPLPNESRKNQEQSPPKSNNNTDTNEIQHDIVYDLIKSDFDHLSHRSRSPSVIIKKNSILSETSLYLKMKRDITPG